MHGGGCRLRCPLDVGKGDKMVRDKTKRQGNFMVGTNGFEYGCAGAATVPRRGTQLRWWGYDSLFVFLLAGLSVHFSHKTRVVCIFITC